MYIKIEEKDLNKINLKNIKHKTFETALQAFCYDESIYRLISYEKIKGKIVKENDRENFINDYSDKLYDEEQMLNYEYLDDSIEDEIQNYIDKFSCNEN